MGHVDFGLRLGFNVGNFSFGINVGNTDRACALQRIQDYFGGGRDYQNWGGDRACPQRGSIPQPNIGYSGAPAGQGLQQNPDGSVTTAGGYRIQAEGKDAAWKIWGPDGKEVTRVWGDPHVSEADGTKWDFTKSSDFVLPDGTRIAAKTNYDPAKGNGQSVTTGLEIMNGTDRASITGVEGGAPQTQMHQDAYEYRAAHLATNPNRDSFYLGGDGNNINWTRERNGQVDGVVTGTANASEGGHHIYDQQIDSSIVGRPTGSLSRPPVGSRAWGNMVRGEIDDAQAKAWGQAIGPAGAWPAMQNAYGIHRDHIEGEFQSDMRDLFFGGWRGAFDNYFQPFSAVSTMVDLLRADRDWRNQLRTASYDTDFC